MKRASRLIIVVGALSLSLSLAILTGAMRIDPFGTAGVLMNLLAGIALGSAGTYFVVRRKFVSFQNSHEERAAPTPSGENASLAPSHSTDLDFKNLAQITHVEPQSKVPLISDGPRPDPSDVTDFPQSILDDCNVHLTRANRLLRYKMRSQIQLETELRERMQSLEQSNRDLEQFAYLAAHDLRGPLLAVTAYLKLLSRHYRENPDPTAVKFVTPAINSAMRMDNLVEGLLSLSLLDSVGASFQPTDSQIALENALSNLKTSINESEARVTWEDLPTVFGDATLLVQLFQNLIENALKFRSDQAPRIRVNASLDDGAWVFSVSDNGIGIEPESREKIFQMFQRCNNGCDCPGSGIGLAACKKIVKRHGGRIWVKSQPGEGSTFFFTIPEGGFPQD